MCSASSVATHSRVTGRSQASAHRACSTEGAIALCGAKFGWNSPTMPMRAGAIPKMLPYLRLGTHLISCAEVGLCAPGGFSNSAEVAAQDSADIGATPAAPAEVFADGEQGFRGHPLDRAPSGVTVVEHVRVAGEFCDEILVVEGEVAADADVVDADQVNGVLQMPGHGVECGCVGSEKYPDAGDADDAAGARAGSRLVVADIAGVIPDRLHAGVAVNHWSGGGLTHVEPGTRAAVRAVRNDTDLVERLDN